MERPVQVPVLAVPALISERRPRSAQDLGSSAENRPIADDNPDHRGILGCTSGVCSPEDDTRVDRHDFADHRIRVQNYSDTAVKDKQI